jgi:hypothetical protein
VHQPRLKNTLCPQIEECGPKLFRHREGDERVMKQTCDARTGASPIPAGFRHIYRSCYSLLTAHGIKNYFHDFTKRPPHTPPKISAIQAIAGDNGNFVGGTEDGTVVAGTAFRVAYRSTVSPFAGKCSMVPVYGIYPAL